MEYEYSMPCMLCTSVLRVKEKKKKENKNPNITQWIANSNFVLLYPLHTITSPIYSIFRTHFDFEHLFAFDYTAYRAMVYTVVLQPKMMITRSQLAYNKVEGLSNFESDILWFSSIPTIVGISWRIFALQCSFITF